MVWVVVLTVEKKRTETEPGSEKIAFVEQDYQVIISLGSSPLQHRRCHGHDNASRKLSRASGRQRNLDSSKAAEFKVTGPKSAGRALSRNRELLLEVTQEIST